MTNTLYLPELREMLAENNAAELKEFCVALHPARTAEFMEGLSAAEAWQVLGHTDPVTRMEIFSYFSPERQIETIQTVDRGEVVHLIADLPPDERVDILDRTDPKIVDELLTLLPPDERRDILRLRSYPEQSAGAIMTTQFARLGERQTVAQALDELRRQAEELETVYYLYVVDDGDHLRGLVSLREIVLAKPSMVIGDIMERAVVSVDVTDDQEEVARKLARFDFVAIPVIDHEHHLVGIVTHDDVIDVVREEATEDAQRIAGVEPLRTGYLEARLMTLTWKRGLWLTILFLGATGTIMTLRAYQRITEELQWLVLFLPLIISSGGNSGSQSATLIITALSTGDISLSDWWRVVRRELLMGLFLGGFLGLIGSTLAWASSPEPWAIAVVPLTLLLVVTCGTLSGSILPLVFRRIGLDPAMMSNPFVSCICDLLGTIIYLEVAMLILRHPR
jgi:magnesium transporter